MPASDLDRRLDGFCNWLGRHGVPRAEDYRSLARGIYLLPGPGGEVGAEHVEQSVEYARDSGADDATLGTLQWLGEQLLVFEEERRTQQRHGVTGQFEAYAGPADAASDGAGNAASRDSSGDEPPDDDRNARKVSGAQPLAGLFDAAGAGGAVASATGGGPERDGEGAAAATTAAADEDGADDDDDGELRLPSMDDVEGAGVASADGDGQGRSTANGASSLGRRLPVSAPVIAAAIVGLAGVAAVPFFLSGSDDEPSAAAIRRRAPRAAAGQEAAATSASSPAAATVVSVPGLRLEIELLPGWHVAPPVAGRNPIAAGAQLYRGPSADAPERTAWLSVLPLPAALTGAQITPETLSIIGNFVEDGLAETMGDTYRRHGCSVTRAAVPTVLCTASVDGEDDEAAAVRTYVRFDDFRALVAVFVTPASEAAADADRGTNDSAAAASGAPADPEADKLVAAMRDAVPDPAVAARPRQNRKPKGRSTGPR